MEIDLSEWYQLKPGSKFWYRVGKSSKHPHYLKACEHCGQEMLMRKSQRFCSGLCANLAEPKGVAKTGGGTNSLSWKGSNITYDGAHCRVEAAKSMASEHACIDCGQPAKDWSYDGLDPEERVATGSHAGIKYSAKPEHYQPRCRKCHRAYDKHGDKLRGEKHPRATLTDDQVAEVIELYKSTAHLGLFNRERWTQQKLADKFGVNQATISKFVLGQSRKVA